MIQEEFDESRIRRQCWKLFFVLLIAQLLCAVLVNYGMARKLISGEAIVRTEVCLDLLAGNVKGRQGLVGSLFWAPLPTLLALPFVPFIKSGFALCIVSALAAAVSGAFINAYLARRRIGSAVRLTIVLLYEIQPAVIGSVVSGRSTVLFSLLTFATFAFFLDWLDSRSLHSLAYFSILLGLDFLTRFQAGLLAIVMLFIILAVLVPNRKAGVGYVEGVTIAYVAPPLYALVVWLAANWLIMGEWTFFLRGLLPSATRDTGVRELLREGCPWAAALLPALIVAIAWKPPEPPERKRIVAAILVAISLAAPCMQLYFGVGDSEIADREEIKSIAQYLEHNHSEDRVAASGYLGYEIMENIHPEHRTLLAHCLSIYLDRILEQTQGKRLYLLVPRPVGAGRWEDINLKFPGIYERGREFTLFEHRWPNWRLFRIVRIDEQRE